MAQLQLTKKEARRFLIHYHHLTDDTALQNKEDILSFIEKVGCIQFDPLNPVGRNADLVLQSRCPTYQKGEIDTLLYEDKKLFDTWDKNMAICPVKDWHYFSRARKHIGREIERFPKEIEIITNYLKENEFASSSDFDMDDKIDWYWAPQRRARAVLDTMHYAGLVTVHHKKGTRRYFSLSENYFGKEVCSRKDPNETLEDYHKWAVKRRINSVGLLPNTRSDAFLGVIDLKSKERTFAFEALEKENEIARVEIEGAKQPYYISSENIAQLKTFAATPVAENNIRILAPLDSFMWDRNLVEELFSFYYRWEVYVPREKRQFGYYVLPVLGGERLIGRIEMKTDSKTHTLQVLKFWFEEGIDPQVYREPVRAYLQRFKKYNKCKRIHYKTGKLNK